MLKSGVRHPEKAITYGLRKAAQTLRIFKNERYAMLAASRDTATAAARGLMDADDR